MLDQMAEAVDRALDDVAARPVRVGAEEPREEPLDVHALGADVLEDEAPRAEVHGDGEQSRDFTYIDDVVEATVLAARAPESTFGRVVNIGGGADPTSVNRILRIVAELTGWDGDPVHTPPREGDVRRTEADISLARELIGYAPKVDIEEGLRRTVDWFRTNANR